MTKTRRHERKIGSAPNQAYAGGVPIPAGHADTLVVNIAGAGTSDTAVASMQTPTLGIVADAYVSASGAVTVRFNNVTNGAITPAASLVNIQILKL
jgi:hypothetical protein